MRLVLVDNILLDEAGDISKLDLEPHLGLISLAAVAREAGHEVIVYDPKWALSIGALNLDEFLYERMAEYIETLSPDVVGFTSLGCNFICVVKVASHLKRTNHELPIILGGPHATILHQEIMTRFEYFDVVVRHESERIIQPLLNALPNRTFADVLGVTYRASSHELIVNDQAPIVDNLDSLPFPAFDTYPIHQLGLNRIHVEAGRGCPFKCTFCSTAPFFGRRYRLKSPTRLCAELDWLNEHYGFSNFKLTHDLFTVDKRKVIAFCEAVERKGYKWSCSARMDCVDKKLLHRMQNAGCEAIYYGVETGSSRMQRIVHKNLNLDLVEPTLAVTIEYGIKSTVSFITGYPHEEQSDQDDTLNLMARCIFVDHDNTELALQLHLLTPEPGTLILKEFGNQMLFDGHISDFNFRTLETDDEEIMSSNQAIFVNHHYYPTTIPRDRNIFVTSIFPTLQKLGLLTFRYLLTFFDRQLSILIDRMYDFWSGDYCRLVLSESFVVAFLSKEVGKHHHVTSLARYIYTGLKIIHINQTNRAQSRQDANGHLCGPDGAYILNPRASTILSIHDCRHILDLLDSRKDPLGQLTDNEAGDFWDYLLIAQDNGSRQINNYIISKEVAFLLHIFTLPRTFQQAQTAFKEITGGVGFPTNSFDDLVQIRAIKPTFHQQTIALNKKKLMATDAV